MERFQPEPFGRYILLDRIATGGMAEIFRAKAFAPGGFEQLVAIKRIRAELSDSPGFVELFADEARLTASLQHPNIVRVYDFGRVDRNFFLVMEHVDGRDLHVVQREVARAGRRVPGPLAAWIVLQACKGLHYAHTRTDAAGRPLGLVHRDVSPNNLLVSWDGDVKVVDFGIATARGSLVSRVDDAVGGTVAYSAPESLDGGSVDARADVFGLGVVLYELLSGRRAFRGDTEAETLDRLRSGDLPPLRWVDPTIPESVEAVVDHALASSPDARYASARELGDALRAAALAGVSDDTMRESLAVWLQDLFATSIRADRERLEAATVSAVLLIRGQQADEAAARRAAVRGARVRGMAAVGTVAVGLSAAVAAWIASSPPEIPQVDVPATGALVVDVSPEATVWVAGQPRGKGTHVEVSGLAPGSYDLRMEADGHAPAFETVRITGGGRTQHTEALTPLPDPEPRRGRRTGRGGDTPAPAPSTGTSTTPAPSRPASSSRTTTRVTAPTGEGSLRVVLGGGATWASVWVDGKKLSRNAPFSGVALPSGAHSVRVVNEGAGLDTTVAVQVSAGQLATVRAVP